MPYLYGTTIQGIQSFIFETDKLKEIIGASEIVEQLSGNMFIELFGVGENDFIMHAAGNVKLVSDDEEMIAKIVKEWPNKVEEIAPGLILSQAVVKFDGELSKNHIDKLELKLNLARNKSEITQQLAPMATIRSRRTGKPATDWKDDDKKPRDLASKLKQNKGHNEAPQNLMKKSLKEEFVNKTVQYPFDVSDMLFEGEETGWLAVIHADGNSLGKIIQKMADKLQADNKNLKETFKIFSRALDKSTINSAKYAFEQIVISDQNKNNKLPFRPVVIGGDDLTVIIRADLALEFTEKFLTEFQKQTKNNLKDLAELFSLKEFENGLTACAGIAYMKASYPFHYAVTLAENLCADAKKASKKINSTSVPASISFHKIQDSFVNDYNEIVKRELTPQKDISFKFGPYGIEKGELPFIGNLKKQVKEVMEKDAPKSGLREWLTLLYEDKEKAKLLLERVREITTNNYMKTLNLEAAVKDKKTHLYDVLSLASISREDKKGENSNG